MFGETSLKAALKDIKKTWTKIGILAQKVEWQMAVLREKNTELAKQNYELKKADRELKGTRFLHSQRQWQAHYASLAITGVIVSTKKK